MTLSPNWSIWVIGFRDGTFKCSNYVDKRLQAALEVLSDTNCKVHNVVIGNRHTWMIQHEQGLTVNCDPKAIDLWDWLDEQQDEIDVEDVNISLYDHDYLISEGESIESDQVYRFIPVAGCDKGRYRHPSLREQVKSLKTEIKTLKRRNKALTEISQDQEQQPKKKH